MESVNRIDFRRLYEVDDRVEMNFGDGGAAAWVPGVVVAVDPGDSIATYAVRLDEEPEGILWHAENVDLRSLSRAEDEDNDDDDLFDYLNG